MSDSTSAEAVKMFAAVYKDVNIALANELSMICDEVGINANEVFDALTRPPAYAPFFISGCGVGGHCIPVCGYGITSIAGRHSRLIPLAREINDGMAEYTVDLLKRGLGEAGLHLRESNVLLLGVTYRGDVKDTLNSPAILIMKALLKKCNEVYAFDPMLEHEVRQFGAKALDRLHEVGDNMQIDAVIIASDHSEFKKIDWEYLGKKMRHKVIVDGRHCVDLPNLRHMGWSAYGI
jgi:nucleotide sugar dehydrogenase